ncbi:MAG TPA: SPOR domain-containing protein [Gemmatimonadaceae bacterium]|nr:SPOR domain-containing protein [Gemmatimonadaceae bacterium]
MPLPLRFCRNIKLVAVWLGGVTLGAYGCGPRIGDGELTRGTNVGPDPIVVRVAQKGGKARAYRYPSLDSAVWTSTQDVPAISALLAFDQENGVLAYADRLGNPGWIDLRLGSVRPAAKGRYKSVATADGWSIYAISTKNDIERFTPTGDWKLSVGDRKIVELLPQQDGTLLVLFEDEGQALVMRVRPPDARWLDSLQLGRPQHVARTDVGDRVYFAIGHNLIAVSTGSLVQAANTRLPADIGALVATPSGDRLYVISSSDAVDVYDRYDSEVVAQVKLPTQVGDLRMDVLGRYVLVKAALGDSIHVISTATNRYLGAIPGKWRNDLPAVGIDGAIASVRGQDVVFIDANKLEEVGRVANGAADEWFFMLWNGFRPRAQGIDQPVQFAWRSQDSLMAQALGDTGRIAFISQTAADSARVAAQRPPVPADSMRTPPPAPVRSAWTVSFAVVLTEERARALASEIVVEGERAHVVSGRSGDTPVFRVVLGPFPTRSDAERVGRASGRQYWVYDGVP